MPEPKTLTATRVPFGKEAKKRGISRRTNEHFPKGSGADKMTDKPSDEKQICKNPDCKHPKSSHDAENESVMDACEECYLCSSWAQFNKEDLPSNEEIEKAWDKVHQEVYARTDALTYNRIDDLEVAIRLARHYYGTGVLHERNRKTEDIIKYSQHVASHAKPARSEEFLKWMTDCETGSIDMGDGFGVDDVRQKYLATHAETIQPNYGLSVPSAEPKEEASAKKGAPSENPFEKFLRDFGANTTNQHTTFVIGKHRELCKPFIVITPKMVEKTAEFLYELNTTDLRELDKASTAWEKLDEERKDWKEQPSFYRKWYRSFWLEEARALLSSVFKDAKTPQEIVTDFLESEEFVEIAEFVRDEEEDTCLGHTGLTNLGKAMAARLRARKTEKK